MFTELQLTVGLHIVEFDMQLINVWYTSWQLFYVEVYYWNREIMIYFLRQSLEISYILRKWYNLKFHPQQPSIIQINPFDTNKSILNY